MTNLNKVFYRFASSRKLFTCILTLVFILKIHAQCDPIIAPQLFGPSETSIFCRNEEIPIGVFYSDTVGTNQTYTFSKYTNGVESSKKGGPLDGNGGQLSVAAVMRSARDAGEYRVTTTNECGASAYSSFMVFYGNIDNLSIRSWGNNTVSFGWAACGPKPAVTYEYAVTTSHIPPPFNTQATTVDSFASGPLNLINGTTYYIHVRVNSVIWDGDNVEAAYFGSNCDNGSFAWQSIRFVSCSGAASVGTLSPVNPISCVGGSVNLAATGGSPYRWYRGNDTTAIAGANLSSYTATLPGQYSSWITTGAGCRGIVSTISFTQTPAETGLFFGGGDFYSGDTVRLGLSNTSSLQSYDILKNGVQVTSLQGIGNPEETLSPDSIYYKFPISSAAQVGIYTVRTTPPNCAAVNFGTAPVNLVTSNTICIGTNTSFSFSSFAANTVFQWQVDIGSGFTNITDNLIYFGATTKTLTITNPPASYYGYKYRCVATGSTSVTSSIRILKFGFTWTGNTSTVWSTASNWNCNAVPGANTDVVIPSGRSRYPGLASSASYKSIQVMAGATITLATGVTVTLTGL